MSLVETTLALFLLVAEVLVLMGLFHQGLRNQTRVLMRTRAVAVLERTMAEIRAWASQPAHFAQASWPLYQGVRRPDPVDPDFTVEIDSRPAGQPLLSPCLTLEQPFLGQAKLLRRSVVGVQVKVVWDASDPHGSLVSNTYLGEPARQPNPALTLTQTNGVSSPVPLNATLDYQVEAFALDGTPLRDLQFRWAVVPLTGNASVLTNGPRSGETAQIQHVYYSNGQMLHISGVIQVECYTSYHGTELKANTGNITLQ